MIEAMAVTTFKKDKRINMLFSGRDLSAIQQRTLEEGIPYQTLVSSVLHAQSFWQLVRCNSQQFGSMGASLRLALI
jgi:predicted DNA binding CopG/RHH family protein